MWLDNILGAVGNTPLVRLTRVVNGLPCTVLAKLEYFNPGGSVKDRIGLAMIEDAERSGQLRPGGTIIEGTSGNTGAGLSLAAITRGYSCIFTTTDKQSQAKIDVLRALGAEVIVCPTAVAPDDPRSYYSVAKRLSQEIPNSFYPNQYDHPANTEAHYRTTGPELWDQTDGRISHYIAGAGTGGTISGATRYLKERNAAIKAIGVDPFGSVYYKYFHTHEFDDNEIYPYETEGVGEDILAGNMDFDLVDDYVRVTDKESMQMTRRLAREEGLFLGQSSGMAMAGALQWIEANRDSISADDVVVVLMPDSGFRYLSKTYNDEWMRQHGYLEAESPMTVRDMLAHRERGLVSVSPDATLSDVVTAMTEHGISQVPVVDREGHAVGSLTERDILSHLVEEPESRSKAVQEIMSAPFPIVEAGITVTSLSTYFDNNAGAVLVKAEGVLEEFRIVTRSDLIAVLAKTG